MIELLIFILATWGLTQIVVYGSIFEKVRSKFNTELLKCPMCFGFWAGVLNYLLMCLAGHPILKLDTLLGVYLSILMFGFIGSASSYALCMIIDDRGLKINLDE